MKRTDSRMNGQKNGQTDGWMDELTGTEGWMGVWMDIVRH